LPLVCGILFSVAAVMTALTDSHRFVACLYMYGENTGLAEATQLITGSVSPPTISV
jgi:hypothetical protein